MASKNIQIIQGEDISFAVTLTDKNTSQPFNLAGFTGATAYFAAASGGSPLWSVGSLLSADLGKVQFGLNEIVTAGLETGDELNIEIHVDQGATRTIAQILGKLSVVAQLFS